MEPCEGGAALNITGDERREERRILHCRKCGQPLGEIYRDVSDGDGKTLLTHMRLTYVDVVFLGDGKFKCPHCGFWGRWSASEHTMNILMERRKQYS